MRRPRDSGQHLLGPHVVGQRVVIRRVLPGETGPTGGPAMTDLLGVCLSWADGVCVVQPETGPTVRIQIAQIVSGKPVPPRPSARLRVSAREAELRTAGLWRTREVEPLGEWRLRVDPELSGPPEPSGPPELPGPSDRVRKHANSCLAMGDPGVLIDDALASVAAFYAQHDVPALIQVEASSETEAALRQAGWHAVGDDEDEFLLGSVSRLRRALPPDLPSAKREVTGQSAIATVGTSTDPEASVRAVIDGDWMGLHGVQTAPAARRRGLATAVVATLLEWAAEQGAMTAGVHVETADSSPQAFWEALGFAHHHTSSYYAPPR
ncbi:MAG: GNAT family N-acetyltransferase [Nocardioidaceae bacterium]|nr:GNAT family N-acetyltransferase [Nocardioidaceae bacterium]